MIRSILLPVTDGPIATSAREFAFWLARREGGSVHALAVIDIKAFEIPVLGTPDGFMPTVVTPPLAESQSLLDEMTAAAKERLAEIARLCLERQISCSTDIKTGIPAELTARAATGHDIVVMARTGYSRAGNAETKLDPLVSQVLRSSIRPVLVAGQEFPSTEVRNLLIAYDGSVHAGRALLTAAELGKRSGINTFLVTISSSQQTGEEIQEPAATFLYNHGVTPQKKVIVGGKPSELICGLVTTMEADLLVMGAYGHSPMREMLFGSTTERVLSHCGTTVILHS